LIRLFLIALREHSEIPWFQFQKGYTRFSPLVAGMLVRMPIFPLAVFKYQSKKDACQIQTLFRLAHNIQGRPRSREGCPQGVWRLATLDGGAEAQRSKVL